MNQTRIRDHWMCALTFTVMVAADVALADDPLRVVSDKQQLVITRGTHPVAKYVFGDAQVLRPYFTALHAPSGAEVTRRHPPREGTDATDLATMHPGLWLAFGDLGGADFWRNKGRVEHVEFPTEPKVDQNAVRFAVVNHYRGNERLVCQEEAAYSLSIVDDGYLLTWDSTFSGSEPFAFGDQEEMGLGVRMATPLCVKGGSGTITGSDGKQNEKQVWGTQSDWCEYSGTTGGQRVGILLIPHAENFRASWLHVRDYGLAVANPFGQKAFTRGAASRIEVKPGDKLRLRFGIWIYSTDPGEHPDLSGLAGKYLRSSGR